MAGLIVPPLTVAFGWQVALVVVAAVCVAVAVVSQPLREPLDDDRDRSARLSAGALVGGLSLVAQSPALRTMALVSFFYSGMQMSVAGFIVAYLHTEIGLGLVAAGTALTVASVAGVGRPHCLGRGLGPHGRAACSACADRVPDGGAAPSPRH